MNKIGNKINSFSVTDLKRKDNSPSIKKVIRDCSYHFYREKCRVQTEEVMWTTFKSFKDKITPRGLKDRFVNLNTHVTNEYQHNSTCIYLANVYVNPVTKHIFSEQGVKVNSELYALSELLQWLFHSRVGASQPINVYPSIRMRTLLERYLNNQI